MVKIHLENWLRFMTSLLKKEEYKLEGDWKCYFLEEPRRAWLLQPGKSKITACALEEEEQLLKLLLWQKNIDINWIQMHSGRKLEEVSNYQRCKAEQQPASRESDG